MKNNIFGGEHMEPIIIKGAREGNLKNISLEIPRNKLVVLTGVSGSGKSTLAINTLFTECQRQYLEALDYQGIRKPKVDCILHASPVIRIVPSAYSHNPRSTVGTVTDIYTDLRMIYEKLAHTECPHCHQEIAASACQEETVKQGEDFHVYIYCSHCQEKIEKLTRTHYSYNTREGACPKCQGLGNTLVIDGKRVLHEDFSLEDGAVDFWVRRYKDYQIEILYRAYKHYHLPIPFKMPVSSFSHAAKTILLYGTESPETMNLFPDILPPKTTSEGKFEGVYPALWRKISEKKGDTELTEKYFHTGTCPECHGEKLNEKSRMATVMGTRLPELSSLSLSELLEWILRVKNNLTSSELSLAMDYLSDLETKIRRIQGVGLGYLAPDRLTMTLSGGEAQRIRLAAVLDSTLSGLIYIMDEPTIGLHPKDTEGIIAVLKELRDQGNTVLVIEHDTDVMRAADYIIDMGPGAGNYGGEIIGTGTLSELMKQETSVTGRYLRSPDSIPSYHRKANGNYIRIENAVKNNLKHLDVDIPEGCLTTVAGVSGSGKSTLVFEVLAKGENRDAEMDRVIGVDHFQKMIAVGQMPLSKMKRSNVATYSGVYSYIRDLFGHLEEAKKRGLGPKHFSFNTQGGRCEYCEGLGYVTSNMLFFEDIEVICPVCHGRQFQEAVLSVLFQGHSIKDVLMLSVSDARLLFSKYPKIKRILSLLEDVGLGYLQLGQTLTSLSNGEGERLKLATELLENKGNNSLYLIDEPTVGLHPLDVRHFLILIQRLVDQGNTVVVIEHNEQVIRASDFIIDLGPGGGTQGGVVVAQGTPEEIRLHPQSLTGRYL